MRRRPNPNSESNIRRIDTKPKAKKQTHGFQVHFLRGAKAVTKMFSDSVHGGKSAALAAARKFKTSAMRGSSSGGSGRSTSSARGKKKRH